MRVGLLAVPAIAQMFTPVAILPPSVVGYGLGRILAMPFCITGSLSAPVLVLGMCLVLDTPCRIAAGSVSQSIATIVRSREAGARAKQAVQNQGLGLGAIGDGGNVIVVDTDTDAPGGGDGDGQHARGSTTESRSSGGG